MLLQRNVRHLRANRRRYSVLLPSTDELLLSHFLHGLHHDQLLLFRQYNWFLHSNRLDRKHLQHWFDKYLVLIYRRLHVDCLLHCGNYFVFLRVQRIQRDAFRSRHGRKLRNDGHDLVFAELHDEYGVLVVALITNVPNRHHSSAIFVAHNLNIVARHFAHVNVGRTPFT